MSAEQPQNPEADTSKLRQVIDKKRSLAERYVGKPILGAYEALFTDNGNQQFVSDAAAEFTAQSLQPGVHLEIGFGFNPHVENRVFSQESPYVGIDGGLSDHTIDRLIGRRAGWLNYENRRDNFKAAVLGNIVKLEDEGRDDVDFIKFLAADAKRMPFADTSVREIYMRDVLLAPGVTQEDTYRIMADAYRVLQDEGLLVIADSEHVAASPNRHVGLDPFQTGDGVNFLALGAAIEAAGFQVQGLDAAQNTVFARKLPENTTPETSENKLGRRLTELLVRRKP